MTLSEVTEKVQKLASNNGGKLGATCNFQFDEGLIHLDDTVSPTVVSNDDTSAVCTVKMSLENFGKMMQGDLNPMMAMMMGKLKIEGDKAVAMKLASMF
ncbi:MAG: SCP2 sterol-binding domain-containing protein [Cyclobacteriaceae bacterium]|nr:SCP2 sterol-binding domain-containing protein [Cyclobacteriaceae bacterium HetDA_MAG_MS6]